jgi:hypothetical protein
LILLVEAILLPFGYGLDLGPGPNRIRALIWEYIDAPWFSGIRIVRLSEMLEALLYNLPRHFFLFQIFSLYRTSLSQKRMWLVGILGALFPGLVSRVLIVGWLQGWTQPPPPQNDHFFPIYIPIPTILIMGIVLLRLLPVRRKDENGVS